MPFRQPRTLILGSETNPAQIYLSEEGIDGFIRLQARFPGVWANQISVSVRACGPALYRLSVIYTGTRFENARQTVLGNPVPALVNDLLQPHPIGILQAKAAGIQVSVSRSDCIDRL